jgi:F0F1-type ATP synthase membrane subunit b/b'
MKMAISIILLLISFLIYIVCVFEIYITSFIKNKIRRKKVKREINQAIQELEEAQQAFNKFKERKYIMTKIEKKLIELGYEEYWIPTLYIKTVDDW